LALGGRLLAFLGASLAVAYWRSCGACGLAYGRALLTYICLPPPSPSPLLAREASGKTVCMLKRKDRAK